MPTKALTSHRRSRSRTLRLVESQSKTFATEDGLGRALRRCLTIAEMHVVGAYFALEAAGELVTRDTLAWAISVELGRRVWPSYVSRGLLDARANGTLKRSARGRYEPGPRLLDLIAGAPSQHVGAHRMRRG